MAKTVVKAAYLSLGGTDISSQCDSIELSFDAAKVTTTNFGSSGWEESLQGIRNATLNFQLKMDSDLSGIEKTIWDTAIHATTNTLASQRGCIAPPRQGKPQPLVDTPPNYGHICPSHGSSDSGGGGDGGDSPSLARVKHIQAPRLHRTPRGGAVILRGSNHQVRGAIPIQLRVAQQGSPQESQVGGGEEEGRGGGGGGGWQAHTCHSKVHFHTALVVE